MWIAQNGSVCFRGESCTEGDVSTCRAVPNHTSGKTPTCVCVSLITSRVAVYNIVDTGYWK